MKPSVYIETSVVGYLAMRPSAQLVTAANQQITHEFWDGHRERFRLFVSLAVINEAMAGDSQAASERAQFLQGIPVLEVTEEVQELANELAITLSLPERASVDAIHIAAATLNGLDYLPSHLELQAYCQSPTAA